MSRINQINYVRYHPKYHVGKLGSTAQATIRSGKAVGDQIPFGAALAFVGAGEVGINSGETKFAGISLANQTLDNFIGASNNHYQEGSEVSYVRKGDIPVIVATDVVAHTTVPKWADDGTIGDGLANDFPGNAYFKDNANAGEVAMLILED